MGRRRQGGSGGAGGRRVAVVVLGDIGRSPRMQYHALALARRGHWVDLVGYGESRPMEAVLQEERIALRHMRVPGLLAAAPRALFGVAGPLKAAWQALALLWLLLASIPRPDVILVQNPPAIPTLPVARVCAWLTGSRLIVDWHNYGYTVLGLRLGAEHPAVALAQRIERLFGRHAYAHLCVTGAMASDLRDRWQVSGRLVVLRDRPPRHFRRLDADETHALWSRLLRDPQLARLKQAVAGWRAGGSLGPLDSLLTTRTGAGGPAALRADRPMLVVSSTSWTADEDFSILLRALALYDARAVAVAGAGAALLPPLAVLITGKGPLRAHYEAEIGRLGLRRVCVATAWLSAEDYPLCLGTADLGVSLHTSTSGLDLPMKVVDMLGCGAPVCAYRFPCIGELVTPANGLVFADAEELARQMQDLAASQRGAGGGGLYARLFRGAAAFRAVDWDAGYAPVLRLVEQQP
ncbi:mannosyltransferase [Coemansia javaensis]|uniref:Chitobiosyldiphosphodolichol beta-mannosyltransferase n=1 Tax=Coemansia javaensis TaxID=2761396 RepID=A0A9W8H8J3_9FUNG|nr:mannosyltransferase [Coemansia javaensis]